MSHLILIRYVWYHAENTINGSNHVMSPHSIKIISSRPSKQGLYRKFRDQCKKKYSSTRILLGPLLWRGLSKFTVRPLDLEGLCRLPIRGSYHRDLRLLTRPTCSRPPLLARRVATRLHVSSRSPLGSGADSSDRRARWRGKPPGSSSPRQRPLC